MPNVRELENALPVAPLKVLAMESAETIGRRVNNYLVEFRKNMKNTRHDDPAFQGYIEILWMLPAPASEAGKEKESSGNPSAERIFSSLLTYVTIV